MFSSLARYSQEPKLQTIFEILWVLFEKISVFYVTDLNPGFGRPWDMLVIFFVNFIFIMLQKKSWPKEYLNFIHGFKSAILAIFQFWQNGTFELVHEIQKFVWPKDFFWSIMKMAFTKNITNMSQGLLNPGFRSVKVENWDFLKKDSQDFKNSFQFWFLWIPAWKAKLKGALFHVNNCKKKQCVHNL